MMTFIERIVSKHVSFGFSTQGKC